MVRQFMMVSRVSVSLLATLAALAAGCASMPSSHRQVAAPTRHVLANGAVVIVQEHRASEVVALQLWMRVGGLDEVGKEVGLSHFLEHMLFKGTPTRPVGSIDTLIEGMGGQSNAFTSYDYSHYDLVIPAERVADGVDLLADIAVHASFDPTELNKERKVVFEEMRLLQDNPDSYLLRRLYEVAYRGYPYGRPILGARSTVEALDREQLAAYYHKLYAVPQHMVLVVVGAVDTDRVLALAERAFGHLPERPEVRPHVAAVPPISPTQREDVARPEKQAYLGLAWRVAATSDPDVYAIDLLSSILGDSPSSRLNQEVRDRQRLVYRIGSGYGAWARAGLFTVTARLEPANLDRAEAAILAQVHRVQREGVTEAELQRAIVTAEADYAFDIETAEGLAKTYGEAETTWTLDNELQYLARLRRTTPAQIQAVAQKYLGDDDYARVRFRPEGTR